MNQSEKARHFKSLHVPGKPVALYNIWDAGGAKALAKAGAAAIATGSWSVAAAHGYRDGEQIPLDFVVGIAGRIAQSVDLPLTVDFEGGYAADPETLTANVRRILSAGAVGINFEDQIVGGDGLYPISEQVERIRAVRRAGELEAVPLFLNARTDLFLKADATGHADLIEAALERGRAFAEAGADGFFVPGLAQPELIERVCRESSLPVNVMMRGELQRIDQVAGLGVARASYGPGPYFAALEDLTRRFGEI